MNDSETGKLRLALFKAWAKIVKERRNLGDETSLEANTMEARRKNILFLIRQILVDGEASTDHCRWATEPAIE